MKVREHARGLHAVFTRDKERGVAERGTRGLEGAASALGRVETKPASGSRLPASDFLLPASGLCVGNNGRMESLLRRRGAGHGAGDEGGG